MAGVRAPHEVGISVMVKSPVNPATAFFPAESELLLAHGCCRSILRRLQISRHHHRYAPSAGHLPRRSIVVGGTQSWIAVSSQHFPQCSPTEASNPIPLNEMIPVLAVELLEH